MQAKPLLVAIDPGAAGGLAWRERNGTLSVVPMPDSDAEVCALLLGFAAQNPRVYMEKVGGFVKGNPTPGGAMFNFGRGVGFVHGVCMAFNIPVVLVAPTTWQKALVLPSSSGLKPDAHKRRLRDEAQRRHPELGARVTLKTCDALLLLDWATAQAENNQKENGQ